ncbi:MAG: hypothetical protein GF401_08745 [Chitinivibrionales bacterium]|nr:hypothetical protein [Chitinivibrionales bacterium]
MCRRKKFQAAMAMTVAAILSFSLPTFSEGGVSLVKYVLGGAGKYDMEDINNEINGFGIDGFNDWAGQFGAGAQLGVGDYFIFGHQFTVNWWEEADGENNLDGGFQTFNWVAYSGVDLIPFMANIPLRFYPQLGVGGALTRLKISDSSFDFDQAVVETASRDALYQAHFIIEIAGVVDYTFLVPNWNKGIIVGARAGFLWQPFVKDNWNRSGSNFTNGPEHHLNSLQLQGFIGLNWLCERK